MAGARPGTGTDLPSHPAAAVGLGIETRSGLSDDQYCSKAPASLLLLADCASGWTARSAHGTLCRSAAAPWVSELGDA
jgi:hypothetical protein